MEINGWAKLSAVQLDVAWSGLSWMKVQLIAVDWT